MADTEAREALVVVVAGWGHMYGPDPTKWPDFAMANVNAYVARLAAPLGDRTPPAVEAGSISEREATKALEYLETTEDIDPTPAIERAFATIRAALRGVPAPPTAPGLEEVAALRKGHNADEYAIGFDDGIEAVIALFPESQP